MARDKTPTRHVWVDTSGGGQHPGLIITWRREDAAAGWEAYVAIVRDGSVLASWVPVGQLHPVVDDRWMT